MSIATLRIILAIFIGLMVAWLIYFIYYMVNRREIGFKRNCEVERRMKDDPSIDCGVNWEAYKKKWDL